MCCGRECAHGLDRCSAGKWPTSRCGRKSRWGKGRRLAQVEGLEDSAKEVVGECRRFFRLLELLIIPGTPPLYTLSSSSSACALGSNGDWRGGCGAQSLRGHGEDS